ncbi:hypothetical protein J6590_102726 [Homalodisca vitripennis]|nr:hypothetical protein J6590_102726 [Homalodisca vitripennis]
MNFEIAGAKFFFEQSLEIDIFGVYRSPSGNCRDFTRLTAEFFQRFVLFNKTNTVITGDINIDWLAGSSARDEMQDLLASSNLRKLVNSPTRVDPIAGRQSLLDCEFRGIDMCDVSEEFKISEIVFPDVKEIYTSEEKELFSSEQETAVKVLQGLNERLGTLGVKEYRPKDVVCRLKSHILFGRKLYAAKVAAAGSYQSVSILMLVYIRRQRRSATLTEVFAKVGNLTSLDSPEGDQEGVNPGEINAVEQNVEAVEVVNLERLRDVIQAL